MRLNGFLVDFVFHLVVTLRLLSSFVEKLRRQLTLLITLTAFVFHGLSEVNFFGVGLLLLYFDKNSRGVF
jgi:hypothetical protein